MATTSEHRHLQRAVDTRLAALKGPEPQQILNAAHLRRKPIPFKRVLALAAAACLAVVCSMSVLAATLPPVQRLFTMVGTELSVLLQPVELSCTSSGVEMQVLAALNDDDMVTVYLSLRDTQGNWLGADTVPYGVQATGVIGFMSSELLDFDEATGTAIYRLTGYGMRGLDEKKTEISFSTLLCQGTLAEAADTGVTAQSLALQQNPPALQDEPEINASTARAGPDFVMPAEEPDLLAPGEPLQNWAGVLPWGDVTAVGVVNGSVHIQVKPSALGRYADASLLWLDGFGRPIETAMSQFEFGACTQEGWEQYSEYIEYVLPLPEGRALSQATLGYSAQTYSDSIGGSWHVTFTLDSVSKERTADCDLAVDGWRIQRVTLSTMGVALYGAGEMSADGSYPEIEVYDTEGRLVDVNGSSTSIDEDGTTVKSIFRVPLPPEQVGRVTVNGQAIAFSR